MINCLTFALSPLGRIGLAVLGVVAFLVAFGVDQRSKGAASAVAKIERHDNEAAKKIRDADAMSRNASNGGMRGAIRDPNAASN